MNRKIAYERFAAGLEKQQVPLWTIEAALEGDDFTIPESDKIVRVRLPAEGWLWQKERLLNILLRQLPSQITKVAWIDCDLLFHHPQWRTLAEQALDTWSVVQLFDYALWLGPNDEVLTWNGVADKRPSLASVAYHFPDKGPNFRIGATGFAWAARRELLERHGFYEKDVTGGGDAAMAVAFYGWLDHWYIQHGTAGMQADAREYAKKFYSDVRGSVGYLPCSISHLWHGSLNDRAYLRRRERLGELGFDPRTDIEDDPQTGLLRWSESVNPELRSWVKSYFRDRREDLATAEDTPTAL
jgi:hypothetical protein